MNIILFLFFLNIYLKFSSHKKHLKSFPNYDLDEKHNAIEWLDGIKT